MPNLFTVPGDVLVGYLLALPQDKKLSITALFSITLVSLLLYTVGILLNDLSDIEIDRTERPDRPLVSGKINSTHALVAVVCIGIFLLITAALVGKNTLYIAVLLTLMVIFYNIFAKHILGIGFITMGLCRGTNIFLGASVFIPNLTPIIWGVAIVEVCYIISVCLIAHHEVERAPKGIVRWLPPVVLIVGFFYLLSGKDFHWIAILSITVAIGSVLLGSISMKANLSTQKVQKKIGFFICCLIPIQAAFILMHRPQSIVLIVALYLLWPFGQITGRKIMGS